MARRPRTCPSIKGMMVRYPVHRRGGDVDEALHAVPQRSIQHVAGAFHIGSVDVIRSVEWQGRRRVDHEVGLPYRPVYERLVPDVAHYDLDTVALGIVEVLHVEGGHRVAPAERCLARLIPRNPAPPVMRTFCWSIRISSCQELCGAHRRVQTAHFSTHLSRRMTLRWSTLALAAYGL